MLARCFGWLGRGFLGGWVGHGECFGVPFFSFFHLVFLPVGLALSQVAGGFFLVVMFCDGGWRLLL